MARYLQFEPLYAIYEQFKANCLLQDHSYFFPTRTVWTLEKVHSLYQRMFEEPDTSEGDFESKLTIQMRDASPEEWIILAEAHLMYYLPPRNHTSVLRRDTVLTYLGRGGASITLPDAFWESLTGFSRVGIQYNRRYSQLWVLLLFAEAVKRAADRRTLLSDPAAMRRLLDEQLERIPSKMDRARDMRHALLYLAFPDHYQPILSNAQRERILQFYRPETGVTETDPDLALQQVHQALARQRGIPVSELHFYSDAMKAEWQGRTAAPAIETELVISQEKGSDAVVTHDPEVTQALKKLMFTKNLIFTGAPGTGKTYTAHQVASALVEAHQRKHVAPLPLAKIEALTLRDAIALALYQRPGERFTNQQILKLPIMAERAASMSAKTPGSVIGTVLGTHTQPGNPLSNIADAKEPFVFDKDPHGWFLSDAGRRYVEEQFGELLELLKQPQAAQNRYEDYVQVVAFHPSYTYEDFVEGLRASSKDGQLQVEVKPGILRVMCQRAARHPDDRYVLIIDEINRANLSKVFGELIMLIEDDKRAGAPNEITVNLPYSGEAFNIPNNLYFIGTLNTADRSIALMDVAMRRRFAFVDVPPRPELVGTMTDSSGQTLDLGAVLRVLNGRIRLILGRSHEIGHSYLLGISRLPQASQLDALEHIWNSQLLPLLEEYFYSRPDTLRDVLKEFVVEEDEVIERFGYAEGEDLMSALSLMAQQAEL